MAKLEVTGLAELMGDLGSIMAIPDAVVLDMLGSQGETVKAAQQASIGRHGLVDTRHLVDSITVANKLDIIDSGRALSVYFRGQHSRYTPRQNKRNRSRSAGIVTNAEVAFINEYGAPQRNIKATQFVREANELTASEQEAAAMEVYDRWLKQNNL